VTTLGDDYDRLAPPMKLEVWDNFIDNEKYLIAYGPQGSDDRKHEYYDILNSDFSLHKRITIDTAGWGVLGITHFRISFSDHLYNADDKVEIIYSQYFYGSENNYTKTNIKTVVINEDGIELQTIDNVILNDDGIFQVDGRTYFRGENEEGETLIYEVAGTLPCKTCSSSESTPTQKAPEKAYDINVFPNPTTNQITLAIKTDKTGMKVHIYSTDGKLVKSASVVNGNNLIDTADLVSGTYIYNVQTDTEVIHASQFVKK
jgi:hypothetical protein